MAGSARRREAGEGSLTVGEDMFGGVGRETDLRIAFLSQQQLHSFNYPYQLGYDDPAEYTKSSPPTFDQPLDANVTGYGTRPGDTPPPAPAHRSLRDAPTRP